MKNLICLALCVIFLLSGCSRDQSVSCPSFKGKQGERLEASTTNHKVKKLKQKHNSSMRGHKEDALVLHTKLVNDVMQNRLLIMPVVAKERQLVMKDEPLVMLDEKPAINSTEKLSLSGLEIPIAEPEKGLKGKLQNIKVKVAARMIERTMKNSKLSKSVAPNGTLSTADKMAICSLAFGLAFWLPYIGFVFAVAALILGIVALKKGTNKIGMAITGIVLASLYILGLIFLILLFAAVFGLFY